MTAMPTGLEHLTPVKVRDTSATERAAFRKCRRQWFLAIAHRLQTLEGNRNFWLGTLVHSGLEVYYRTLMDRGWRSTMDGAAWDEIHNDAVGYALDQYMVEYEASVDVVRKELGFLWASVEPEFLADGELGFEMLQSYFMRERTNPLFDEILDVEHRLAIPIRSKGGRKIGELSVQTDVVGRRAGVLGVADHKTAARELSSEQLELDDQLTAECYAVYMTRKEFPETATYNALLKRIPKPPKELKPDRHGNRKLSKDKHQLTTYQMYKDEIERLGLDPAEYAEILQHFWEQDQTAGQYFVRERVLRSPNHLRSFEENLAEEWRDIRAVAAHPERAYPNPSPFSCPSCPVRLVCMAMNDDGDVSSLIQANYVIGDPRR